MLVLEPTQKSVIECFQLCVECIKKRERRTEKEKTKVFVEEGNQLIKTRNKINPQ